VISPAWPVSLDRPYPTLVKTLGCRDVLDPRPLDKS